MVITHLFFMMGKVFSFPLYFVIIRNNSSGSATAEVPSQSKDVKFQPEQWIPEKLKVPNRTSSEGKCLRNLNYQFLNNL